MAVASGFACATDGSSSSSSSCFAAIKKLLDNKLNYDL